MCVPTQPFFSIKSFPGSSNLHTTQNVHPKTKQLQKRLLVKNKKIEKRRPTTVVTGPGGCPPIQGIAIFSKRFVLVHVFGSGKVFYREKRLGWNTHAFELSSTSFTRLKSPSTSLSLLLLLLVILLSTLWSATTMF